MFKLMQIRTSELVGNISNHGRLASATLPNKELIQSIFESNQTASQNLLVIKVNESHDLETMVKVHFERLEKLKEYNLTLNCDGKKFKLDENSNLDYKIKPKFLNMGGMCRGVVFGAKLALTGIDELLWVKVYDSEEVAITESRKENTLRKVGVQEIQAKDYFAMAMEMIKNMSATNEASFAKGLGLKERNNMTQRIWSLAKLAHREPEILAQVASDNIGGIGIVVSEVPHTITKKMLDAGTVEGANAVVAEWNATRANKAKAIAGREIMELAELTVNAKIRTLLKAIAEGDSTLAKVTIGEINTVTN